MSAHPCDPVRYLVVGHVTHDVQPDRRITPGGTVSYASLTAAALNGSVGILTCAGPDFDAASFDSKVRFAVRPSGATTTFENLYVNGSRKQIVHAVADRLTAADVPDYWRDTRIVHIGPVLNECDFSLLGQFNGSSFLGITPQGWMRSRGADGLVRYHGWESAELYLSQASAVVLSIEDLAGSWSVAERFAQATKLLVVTTGARGGVLYQNGSGRAFPALSVTEVDPTGAGDVFAAGFFTAVAQGTSPMAAAHFAACLAAFSVTRVGLAGVPRPEEVQRCSACLLDDGAASPSEP